MLSIPLALLLGALTVLGFAPFSLSLAPVIALAGLQYLLAHGSAATGFARGWAFGLGLFGCGVFWIRISLNEFGNMPPWTATLLTIAFIAAMALYYGLLGWLVRALEARAARHGCPDCARRRRIFLLLPGAYVLFEWLRGWLFTGFPWLDLGYTQTGGPLAGYAPLLGAYGVSLLVALSGALLWTTFAWRHRARLVSALVLLGLWLGGLALDRIAWSTPDGPALTATVLQGNIAQTTKWQPGATTEIAGIYLELTRQHLDSDLIVWPETVLPAWLDQVRAPLIEPLGARARREGSEIVMGIPMTDAQTGRYYNGLISLGSHEDSYTKRHLVPFGEYLPFKQWLGPLVELFEVPMSNFSAGPARAPLLQVGAHQVGVSICYEDAFPAETISALPQARYLISVSNDAWFGDSLAPHQHLEMSQLRALEARRYLVRATNTGISAIIDPHGRIVTRSAAFARTSASATIQPLQGITPYARFGNWPTVILAGLMILLGALPLRRPPTPERAPT